MDKERILSRLDLLNGYLQDLDKHTPKSQKEYSANVEKRRFVERTLQLSIEVCIDLCALLVRELKLGLPSEEESVFDKLVVAKVISPSTKSKLSGMKSFSNVLIHKYVEINDRLVYENATKNLKDFRDFQKEILKFIKKR